ncbi:hypothetical protein H7I57_19965 [Mycobacterium pyrenivorans]|nr:hypothetical protein [Mycolicibacterium pyrenivorans]
MKRLRALGIDLQGARNTALRELVSAIPAPLVAEMLGYSDKVTQKHVAEAGNTWAQYASGNDRTNIPRRGSQRAMTDPSQARANDATEQSEARFDESALFDVDPPVRPYDVHLESLSAAATALSDARNAVQRADEQLAQVVLQARQAGLSWTKIATRLGTSRQAAYQRWSSRQPTSTMDS